MLLTMAEAYKQKLEGFPNPERIDKVEESMESLETVVRERNRAYWKLEVRALCGLSSLVPFHQWVL